MHRTFGSVAPTGRSGRVSVPSTTVRPALPPGSFGSARRARAASSMPDAVKGRSIAGIGEGRKEGEARMRERGPALETAKARAPRTADRDLGL